MEIEQKLLFDKIQKMTSELNIQEEPEINEEIGLYECNACMRVRGDIIKCDTCTYQSCTECRDQFEEVKKICAGCRQSIIKPKPKLNKTSQTNQNQNQAKELLKYLIVNEIGNKVVNPLSKRQVIKDGKIGLHVLEMHNKALLHFNLNKNDPEYFQKALQIINTPLVE